MGLGCSNQLSQPVSVVYHPNMCHHHEIICHDLVELFPVSIQQPKVEKKSKTGSLASESAGGRSVPETKPEVSDSATYLNRLEMVPPEISTLASPPSHGCTSLQGTEGSKGPGSQ